MLINSGGAKSALAEAEREADDQQQEEEQPPTRSS